MKVREPLETRWSYLIHQAVPGDIRDIKEGLQVFQLESNQPFVLRNDASDFAFGAVLE